MYTFLTILVVLASILLMLVVLVQNPKGSGLSSAFGGAGASSQMMGVKKTTDFLEKLTWGLAIFIFAISIMMNLTKPTQKKGKGEIEKKLQQPAQQAPTRTPDLPENMNNLPSQPNQQQNQNQQPPGGGQ